MLNDIPCAYTDVDYFLCDAPPHLVDVEVNPDYTLEECEGDCDDDSDCEGDLVCFHNVDGSSDVAPGCQGTATANWDYCYDKLLTDNPTVDPTSVPTTSPTRGPSTDPTEQPTGIPTANPTEKPSEYVMEHQTAISWSDANAYCAGTYGTTLATIRSDGDANTVLSMKQSVGSVHVWVGLNDIGTEGDWQWISGYEWYISFSIDIVSYSVDRTTYRASGNGDECIFVSSIDYVFYSIIFCIHNCWW